MVNQKNKWIFVDCIVCMVIGAIVRLYYCISFFVPVRDTYVYEEYIRQWTLYGEIPEGATFPPLGLFILRIPSLYYGLDIIKGDVSSNTSVTRSLFLSSFTRELFFAIQRISCFVGIKICSLPLRK